MTPLDIATFKPPYCSFNPAIGLSDSDFSTLVLARIAAL
jgi:hypothetical protein